MAGGTHRTVGAVIRGFGCVQQWPQVAIANKLAQQLSRLEAEFGMTPSARSRIQVEQRTLQPSGLERFRLKRDPIWIDSE